MKVRILWAVAGRIGAQPMIAISVEGDDPEELETIRTICNKRKPKPESVEIMGGNFEPCVFLRANELHVDKKAPKVVPWLQRKIAAEYPDADFEIVSSPKRTSSEG